ncbi:ammonium transporter [Campylobacter coli]|uniref:Ammonium transporter n=2 Tax=Campylobacter coli TaxID=195 RepID=A0A644SAJ4_CAMCO|nr:ammonium transporter [Campylobacter coli]EAH6860319.1 ammonium transporter [Campylobacter coli]EAH7177592.1 ammonium transporter [Campylobacter coli]EAH7180862.1 ammonium transporter [Campylobacter coli]EAH7501669.1 ammonium transporter [Campylobacter coli]EAH7506409.1 ammonium transporter [Campylobacter coli]
MNAINSSFIVLCTLLVLLMTPALAMFYSGMVRSKNTLNTIMNCFIVFGVITLQWVVLGFSLSFGKDEGLGLVGNFENFLLEGISGYNASGVPNILFVIFQMMFALIASAIITGSLVGRIKLGVLVIFLLFWSTLVYDVLAHMIWSSEGFLLKRGSLDFAGGGVVHISSGVAGLVGALMVGARKSDDEDKNAHSIPYAFLGAILLFIGWLGFNAGSAGEMNDIAINAFIVSIISAACGFLSWVVLEWFIHKKPTILGGLSGLVAGLVGITPACGYVDIYASLVIGALSSVFCYFGLSFIKYKLKWDDSLDAFSLHGIGGIWGGIATGLFASAKVNPNVIAQNALGEGFFISGSLELLKEQFFAIVICVVLSALVSFIIFKIISCFTDLRVKEEVEQKGLDVSLHGEKAYTLA